MTDSISEMVRQAWKDSRQAAAKTGIVDCAKVQDLIAWTHENLAPCHKRLAELTWNLIRLDMGEENLTPTDAAFLFLLTSEIQEMEEAAFRDLFLRRKRHV